MRSHRTPYRLNISIIILLITLIVCSISIPPAQTHAQQMPKQVLIVNSYHQGLSWSDSIVDSIETTLEAYGNVETQIEYMETRRIYNDTYLEELLSLYKLRFQDRHFDVIITIDNNAFDFFRQHRDTLFSNTPVIFCGVNNYQASMLDGINDFTGVAEDVDIEETISLALSLHPDTQNIYIINDQTNTANTTQALIDQAFKPYKNNYEIENIRQFNWTDLQDKVAKLPPDSLIFLFVASRDKEDVFHDYDEVAKILGNAANAPIYGVWDFYLEHGIVGGKLTSGSTQGETAAKMAIQVLNGKPIDTIPVMEESPNPYSFDHQQLKRWQIRTRSLPEESIILNNPYRDFLETNKNWILISGFGLLSLSMIIAILVLAVRKRTEKLSLANENLQEEIEERKRIARELEVQQIFSTLALDNVHTSVISRNVYSEPQYYNNAFLKTYGIPDKNIPVDSWNDYFSLYSPIDEIEIPPEKHPHFFALQGNHLRNAEYILITKDQKKSHVWINSYPLQDHDGNITGTVCTTYDITHYKQADQHFQQLTEASPIPVIIVSNVTQNTQFINRKFTETFGYTIEDIPNSRIWMEKAYPDAAYREHIRSTWGRNAKTKVNPGGVEVQVTCKDGSTKTVEGRAAQIGENIMLLYNDISDRKMMELALQEERTSLAQRVEQRTKELSLANAELSRAARLKDEFLASMSHELRTPLNAILGLSECLKEKIFGPLNEKQFKYIKIIEDSGKHLLALINDILDVARIEAGEMLTEPEKINVRAICQSSIKFIENRAAKKDISITTNYAPDVGTVIADKRRLKQMLINLLNNAVKFTPKGGKIGLDIQTNTNKDTIDFIVWDTGIGIAQENIHKLFRPFVQLDSSLARSYEGTGLGLSLVYRLAQMHGGNVSVTSEVGKGSRFTITLPLEQQAANQTQKQFTETLTTFEAIKQVLIIEDDPTASNQISRYLSEWNISSNTCPQGSNAFEEALRIQPDVIILDILLPGKNGWEILKQLKQHPATQHIPVLIISIVDEPEKARALGASSCLVKPISRQELQIMFSKLENELIKKTAQSDNLQSYALQYEGQPTILLAEDNPENAQTVSDYLSASGYTMVIAQNGAEALQKLETCRPSLILMDIQMPVMDGLEAIQRIRQNTAHQHLPVIALTALAMSGDRERCLEAGADEYLSKPIKLKELLKLIERVLEK